MKVEAAQLNRIYRRSVPTPGARGPAKLFRRKVELIHAVKDVSFELPDGAALGYIGMNGAGKSTTLKMLTGVLAPSSGSVRLDGLDPMRNRRNLSRRIGYLAPLKGHLWWDLPAMDTFRLVARMYDLDRRSWTADLDRLVDELEFAQQMNVPVRQLSTGNRVKAELICTVLPKPDLIILDEPTIGLDLLAKEAIHRVIKSMRAELGATLVLASHDMRDVDVLCDELIIIDRGVPVRQGTVAAIRKEWSTSRLIHVDYAEAVPDHVEPGLTFVSSEPLSATYSFESERFPAESLRVILANPKVLDIRVESLDLAEVVRRIYAQEPSPECP